MINKEERVKQLATMFAKAIKGIEADIFDNAVLIPFSKDDVITVTVVNNGVETVQTINAPK